ncbi:STAS domain-containing protein [Actinoplanes sp. GCM10030250]|uniref:STAS domain-containing protein n=1 Tax=Actinoplanes sp. GCM10030250 TaxID=3273376 RepID=UPI0036148CC6
MTALSVAGGAGVHLICDDCGLMAAAGGCGLQDTNVVYVAASAIGWTGPAFARGPHRCPSCATVPSPRRHPESATAGGESAAADGEVSLEVRASVALVRVSGNLGEETAAHLQAVLERAVAARRAVVVDLTMAGRVDQAGLRPLVRAGSAARHRGGEVLLAAPPRLLRGALRLMGLHRSLRVFGSVQQAITAAGAWPVAQRRRDIA